MTKDEEIRKTMTNTNKKDDQQHESMVSWLSIIPIRFNSNNNPDQNIWCHDVISEYEFCKSTNHNIPPFLSHFFAAYVISVILDYDANPPYLAPFFFSPFCPLAMSGWVPCYRSTWTTVSPGPGPSTGPPPRRPRRGRGPAPAGRPAQGPAKRPRRGWGDFEEKHLGSFNNILMTSVLGVELHLCLMILMT